MKVCISCGHDTKSNSQCIYCGADLCRKCSGKSINLRDCCKWKSPVIYFMKESAKGYIKIGITKRLEHRVKEVKALNPHDITILKIIMCLHKYEEQRLHEYFQDLNINGEWYHPGEELLNYIEAIQPYDNTQKIPFRLFNPRWQIVKRQA